MSGRHEPCGAGEVWVGNTAKGEEIIRFFREKGLRTARLGTIAYDIDGKPLPTEHCRPIFINRVEEMAHNDIMMKETFGQHWRRNF